MQMLSDAELKERIRGRARDQGFADMRVAPARLESGHEERLRRWLEAGMHGEMAYMEKTVAVRADARHVLDGAQTVMVFAAPYHPGPKPENPAVPAVPAAPAAPAASSSPATPAAPPLRIAKYALGEDYHYVFRERLAPLVEELGRLRPGHQWRICVDSAPLLERAYAVASGIGFFGRNSLVIAPGHGSFFLLAEIVTTALIEPDPPIVGTCGTCTRCIDACPTQAIVSPGIVDSRRCLSYLTIEKKSPLTAAEQDAVGTAGWVFGCDICQDVCPYNKHPLPNRMPELAEGKVVRREETPATFLDPPSNRVFERRFDRSPFLRPGRRRLTAHVRAVTVKSTLPNEQAEPTSPNVGHF